MLFQYEMNLEQYFFSLSTSRYSQIIIKFHVNKRTAVFFGR